MNSLKAIINIILGKPVVANVCFDQDTKITLEKDRNKDVTITGCHFAAQPLSK